MTSIAVNHLVSKGMSCWLASVAAQRVSACLEQSAAAAAANVAALKSSHIITAVQQRACVAR